MADLIYREAVLDTLKFKPIDDGGVVDDCIMQVLALAKSKVSRLPAVDAVEVVRCRDCEHWDGFCYCNCHAADGKRRFTDFYEIL